MVRIHRSTMIQEIMKPIPRALSNEARNPTQLFFPLLCTLTRDVSYRTLETASPSLSLVTHHETQRYDIRTQRSRHMPRSDIAFPQLASHIRMAVFSKREVVP